MIYQFKKSESLKRIAILNNYNRNQQIVKIKIRECRLTVKKYDLTCMLAFTGMFLLKYIFMFMFL